VLFKVTQGQVQKEGKCLINANYTKIQKQTTVKFFNFLCMAPFLHFYTLCTGINIWQQQTQLNMANFLKLLK